MFSADQGSVLLLETHSMWQHPSMSHVNVLQSVNLRVDMGLNASCHSCGSGKEVPDEATLEHLGEMLWFADQAYEGESERTLHGRLMKRGAFAVLCATKCHTRGEHCSYIACVAWPCLPAIIDVGIQ